MVDLEALRADIDKIDQRLMRALVDRFEKLSSIAELKRRNNWDAYDQQRHDAMIQWLGQDMPETAAKVQVEAVFQEIFRVSLDYIEERIRD